MLLPGFCGRKSHVLIKKLLRYQKYPKSSVLRVRREGLNKNPGKNKERKRCKRGCPEVLTGRDKRNMRPAIMKLRESGDPNFTVMKVVERSGVSLSRAHYRTFVRYIHKMGFAFRQTMMMVSLLYSKRTL